MVIDDILLEFLDVANEIAQLLEYEFLQEVAAAMDHKPPRRASRVHLSNPNKRHGVTPRTRKKRGNNCLPFYSSGFI